MINEYVPRSKTQLTGKCMFTDHVFVVKLTLTFFECYQRQERSYLRGEKGYIPLQVPVREQPACALLTSLTLCSQKCKRCCNFTGADERKQIVKRLNKWYVEEGKRTMKSTKEVQCRCTSSPASTLFRHAIVGVTKKGFKQKKIKKSDGRNESLVQLEISDFSDLLPISY